MREKILQYLSTCKAPFELVKHMHEVPVNRLRWPAIAEIKYDGVFCAVIVYGRKPEDVMLVSRTGRLFGNQAELLAALAGQLSGELPEGVYITELVNDQLSLEELSGLVNPNRKAQWTTAQFTSMYSAMLWAHDYLTVAEFLAGESSRPRCERMVPVQWHKRGGVVSRRRIFSGPEFEQFAELVTNAGHEGAVLKQYDAPWEAGHKGWHTTKVVRGISLDLRCVSYDMGRNETKREGQICKLEFAYKGGTFWADLGRGWTDEERVRLTCELVMKVMRHEPLGIFTVTALQESSTGLALRLPKVGAQRFDKDTPDA